MSEQAKRPSPRKLSVPRLRGAQSDLVESKRQLVEATSDEETQAKAGGARALALAKLVSSGLDAADMRKLRMEALPAQTTRRKHGTFLQLPSLYIPYFDPRDMGKPLRPRPHWPAFYRLRYLREPGTEKPKDIRYTNESEAGVAAYFPTLLDWPSIIEDPDRTIIITEGELKAACAARRGYPCVGLGGVWNFRSATLGTTFLPELEVVRWVKRRVYIMFDSDVARNVMVQGALNALAEELAARGALPFIVSVPESADGKKQGLDDWVVNNPESTLQELCQRHQPLTTVRKLHELNERFAYVLQRGIIVERRTKAKYPTDRFREAQGNADYAELTLTENGLSLKKTNAAAAWLKWPCRAQVEDLCYEPGKGEEVGDCFNLWKGWAFEPREGDVTPFIELVEYLFTGADKGAMRWFLQWCAYPIQHPGVKLFTAAVIHGTLQGLGKSLIGVTLGAIYGDNFTLIKQGQLHSAFNSWAECRQLVLGDDVTGSDKRADNDMLKTMITQLSLTVNAKYMPEYTVRDCVNYLFTSNQPDSFFLETHDRRFFVHEVTVAPLSDDFYRRYQHWLSTGGPSALFHYLLKYDTSDFNPNAAAFRTSAKDRMIAAVQSDLGDWSRRLLASPDSMLVVGEVKLPGDLFSARELLPLYNPMGTKNISAQGILRELLKAGAVLVDGGRAVTYSRRDAPDRYFALRNAEKWARAPRARIEAELRRSKKGK